MNEEDFDKVIDELIEHVFEIHAGNYNNDRCLEFDDVLEILQKHLLIKPKK